MAKQSFQAWLDKVSNVIQRETGLGVFDLADQPYHDWYDDGYTPREAASEALENEGYYL